MKKIIKEEQKDQINNFQDSILMPIPVPKPDNSIEMEDIKPSV